MTMSKKIMSLALAVVMLISVFAFSSSAALSDGEVGLKLVTSAKVGDAAGTEVTVDIYYTFPGSLDLSTYTHSLGNLCLAFTDAFQIDSEYVGTANCGKDALVIGNSYTDVFKPDFTVNDLPTQWTNISAKFNGNDNAKGWDDAILVVPTYLSGGTYNAKTGYPMVADAPICTIKFVTTRTVTADDSFGIPEGTIGNLSKVQYYNGSKSVAYDTAAVIMTEATSFASAAAVEYDVKNIMGKNGAIADKHLNGDGTCTVAVFYGFDSALIDPDFDDNGTSNSIEAITATVTATVGEQSATKTADSIRFVYDLGSGMYGFRVIIKNVDVNADVVVTPALTLNGTVDYSVETVSFNVSAAEAL